MVEASEIRGIVPRTIVKQEMNFPEGLPGLLPHRMEVGLHTVLLVSTGKVRNEPRAEFLLEVD
jgi:hypothetical protein